MLHLYHTEGYDEDGSARGNETFARPLRDGYRSDMGTRSQQPQSTKDRAYAFIKQRVLDGECAPTVLNDALRGRHRRMSATTEARAPAAARRCLEKHRGIAEALARRDPETAVAHVCAGALEVRLDPGDGRLGIAPGERHPI